MKKLIQKFDTLRKIFFLLGNKKGLPFLFSLFLISSMLDFVGVGLVGPFVVLIATPEKFYESNIWNYISPYINLSHTKLFLAFGIGLILVFLAKGVAAYIIQIFISKYGFNKQKELTVRLTKIYQKIPYEKYLKYSTSNLINTLSMDIFHFIQCMLVSLYLISGIFIVASLLVLLAMSNFMAMIVAFIFLGGVLYLIDKLTKKKLQDYGKEISTSRESIIKSISHAMIGFKEIRLLNREFYFLNKIEQYAQKFANSSAWANSMNLLPRYAIEFAMVTFVVLLSFIIVLGVGDSSELISTLGIFGVSAMRLIPIASQIGGGISSIKQQKYAINKLYNEINSYSDLQIEKSSLNLEKIHFNNNNCIYEVKNAVYYYPETKAPAINNISLSFKHGESIAFIGKSGSGKTTLINIILGLLKLKSGDVIVDNKSIYSNLQDWQSHIAYIPQNFFLSDDTLKRNIALGVNDEDIDEIALKKAIEMSQLSGLIKNLSDGVETVIGENGIRLSGGQKQRVGIARAFYFKRDILIMDEATSSVDVETEKEIVNAVNSLQGKITLIVVAHRLSTVKNCDYIYEFANGNIVNSGKPEKILANKA